MGNRSWANTLIRQAQDLLSLAEALAPDVVSYEAWEIEMGKTSDAFAKYKATRDVAQVKAINDAVAAATGPLNTKIAELNGKVAAGTLDAADLAAITEMNGGTSNAPPITGGGVTMPPPPPPA